MERVSHSVSHSRIGSYCGNYRLERVSGKGNFGITYLGKHQHLGTLAAIKIPYTQTPIDRQQQFIKEARIAARLQHPHIVRVLEYGKEGKLSYLIMEYAPEGTLRQRHPRGEILPSRTVIHYVKQVADALQYIHDLGLIHRDVKPDNMLLSRTNGILLSDFGITITVREAETLKEIQSIGTVSYMAPEQIQGNPCFASDQYALGIITYEWLCGQLPFQGNAYQVAHHHLYTPPPSIRESIPSIPATVEQVVLRALAKNPEERFADVQAFEQSLEEAYEASLIVQQTPQLILPYILTPRTNALERKNMLRFDRNFSGGRKRHTNSWKEAALLFTADIAFGIAVFAILYLLGIQLLTPWFFLTLCFVSLPLLAAMYLKRRGILLYTSAVLALSAAAGISFHSPTLFIVLYIGCLLISAYISFTLSIRDD